MRVTLDRDRCEGHGLCVDVAPELFSFDDADEIVIHHPEVPEGHAEKAATAVRVCPVAALAAER